LNNSNQNNKQIKILMKCIKLLIIAINIFIVSCNNNKSEVSINIKNTYDAKKLDETIKNVFVTDSDTSKICISELNNFDTLKYIYSRNDYNTIWFSDLENNSITDSILKFLINADKHGLNPSWYNADILCNNFKKILNFKNCNDSFYTLLTEIEILLSDAVINYSNNIEYGCMNPLIEYDNCYFLPLKQKDSLLYSKVLNPNTILSFLNEIQPKSKNYITLQQELAFLKEKYWDTIAQPDTPKIYLGDSNIVLKQIAKRLIITNELDSTLKNNSFAIYDTILQKSVILFQKKHGLLADGVIGINTISQLNISAKDREDQIRINLERLRWNNFDYNNVHININLPEFMLYAYNFDTLKLALKICCGEKKPKNYNERFKKYLKTHKIQDRPPNHETPIFQSKISHIVLNPDWMVPTNIIQKELYYNFLKDPGYLSDHEYKVFLNDKEINPDSINWRKYEPNHIPFKIKQNPGEINSLGKIKFVFYNPFDVFLHDTPSKSFFERATRAFSHGCIRVEKPLKLVELFINNDKSKDLNEIRMTIGLQPEQKKQNVKYSDKIKYKKQLEDFKKWQELFEKDSVKLETKKIILKKDVPIVINYFTAFVDTNGFVNYRDDLYKRDLIIKKVINKYSLQKSY